MIFVTQGKESLFSKKEREKSLKNRNNYLKQTHNHIINPLWKSINGNPPGFRNIRSDNEELTIREELNR